jgi:hypothetical protein
MRFAASQAAGASLCSPPGTVQASAASPGLVSSKTSGHESVVSFAPNEVAERRVNALKRAVWSSGHLHAMRDLDDGPSVCWFVTLTYRGVDDWRAHHVSAACKRFRRWCLGLAIPCRYTWEPSCSDGALCTITCWPGCHLTYRCRTGTTTGATALGGHTACRTQRRLALVSATS